MAGNKHTYQKLTDEEIIESYKKTRDKNCIGELFNRYGAVVYGVCLKYLKDQAKSQDMVMQVFEKLMTRLLEKPVLNFRAWLHVVSRNECLMLLRRQKNIHYQNIDETYDLSIDETELKTKQLEEIQLSRLEAAIKQLKPEQQKCIELFYIKENCYQDVAEITGYSMKQVKSYIQNGKRNLGVILSKDPQFAT